MGLRLNSVNLHIANDLRLAASDLEAAKTLSKIHNRNDAYHAQQAAEKILLSLLTAEGTHIERKDSHRLDVLRDKLPDESPFKSRFGGLTYLTAYATTFRYPKDAGRIPSGPEDDELLEAINQIESLLGDVAGYFGVDLAASDRVPSVNIKPPR